MLKACRCTEVSPSIFRRVAGMDVLDPRRRVKSRYKRQEVVSSIRKPTMTVLYLHPYHKTKYVKEHNKLY